MIVFNEKAHSYTSILGDPYTSVTTLISSYKPDEDWDKIAERYIKKHKTDLNILVDLANKAGLTMDEAELKFGTTFSKERIREIWKQKGTDAARGGTNWHNWKEKQDSGLDNSVYIPLVNGEKKAIDLTAIESNKVYLEMMLYNNKAKVCGQADKVITLDNTCIIRDYKVTDKELTPHVPAYWKSINGRRRQVQSMFKQPLDVLHNSYWSYALQLSTYGYMMETYGFPPEKLIIDQVFTRWIKKADVTKDEIFIDYDPILDKFRVVEDVKAIDTIPYLKDEVKKILK